MHSNYKQVESEQLAALHEGVQTIRKKVAKGPQEVNAMSRGTASINQYIKLKMDYMRLFGKHPYDLDIDPVKALLEGPARKVSRKKKVR